MGERFSSYFFAGEWEWRPGIPEELGRLDTICFVRQWQSQDFDQVLAQKTTHAWTGRISGESAGYVCVQFIPPELEILRLGVIPEFRNQGLARKILKELESWARTVGGETIFLEVHETNHPARRLYAGRGFQEVKIRKGYYTNPPGNALLLRKTLG
ncbi:MAG: ribosomal-protein-alanine N-acetyltransferase [Deltaproteobacteria bacterium]|jgi:ribosomal-protein-alanine N-acetyltransferase|nr:ribosomal-protein-alanine N-acetyltransferase [Deltaproteobacteria bacterium]MDP7158274.1 ribosomal protein S18-alanine N-acetyltransferase [SAR324 cluster bacterium]MDP7318900.1 ribosomal protein S18-alanine N-acetyltransferase [SAR324 cluster bacterium]MDP7463331.1 ribosomal protein S18-alanine N-acetyltransferase [SAR324 cluster bacterium]MDP7630158.1 ribosomal protein S18-alanine N-acetyltransferase [SAR324 cluster bacterium]|tara:strand:- start:155 stop:622 length:468 start_codon:yes stop_codon:yes gene_type:complete